MQIFTSILSGTHDICIMISNDIDIVWYSLAMSCYIHDTTASHVPGFMGWATGKTLGTAILWRLGISGYSSMPVRIQLQTPELQMMDVLPYAELLGFVYTQIVGSYTSWLSLVRLLLFISSSLLVTISHRTTTVQHIQPKHIRSKYGLVAWKWRHWHLWLWRVHDL